MRPPVFLLAIFVCLAGAQRSDTDDNSLALGGGISAASLPVLVANGGDDAGSAVFNDIREFGVNLLRGSDSNSNGNTAPRNQNSHTPSSTQPDSDPGPEDQPQPVPIPDCSTVEGIVDTPVCCIDPPVPSGGSPGYTTTLWSVSLCSSCKSHLFFHFQCGRNLPVRKQ